MPTVLELKDQRAQIWQRMKEINDKAEAEQRDLASEEQANWNQADADIKALDARIARQEQLERKPAEHGDSRQIATATLAVPQERLIAMPEYQRAFGNFLRVPRLTDLDSEDRSILARGFVQHRAMGTNVPTAGGYLVPETLSRSIDQALLEYGGMREVATVFATEDGGDFLMPTSDDTSNTGEILAENTAASEQDITVGAKVFKAYMYSSKIIRASIQFLQDGAIDVEAWLAARMAERLARITNSHFTTGTGANQPSGIAGDATTGVTGATGQTTTVTWDDLISLEHSVDPAYRRAGCRWMFHDNTLQAIKKLKDGEGRYLWQPGLPTTTAPSTIMNYPYTINQDVAVMAASAISIYFGLLTKYHIRDVRGRAVMRLDERYAEYLQVGFLAFSRHDGLLLDAGTHPVKTYVNSAS